MKAISIMVISLSLITSCKKKKEICKWSLFTFEHPVSVYPVQESYSVGDTIWFEMNFSDQFNAEVMNNITGETRNENVQLKNFDFHRNFLRILKLVDTTQSASGLQSGIWGEAFDPIYLIGSMTQELPDGPEYKLKYDNGSYHLKYGMILMQTGTFLYFPIFKHYYPDSKSNVVDIRPECENEQIDNIHFPLNKQVDGSHLSNYHIFEQFLNPLLEIDKERFKNECFTFVVN